MVRVLVIEDDPSTARLLDVCLARMGLSVTLAAAGFEALIRLRDEAFDAVVLDLKLPDIDGFSLLRRIRANPAFERTPIFVVTAMEGDSVIFRAYEAGADMFFQKPFNPREIAVALGGSV